MIDNTFRHCIFCGALYSIETDAADMQSDVSVETVGNATNPSIVTGSIMRTDSPMTRHKLSRHQRVYTQRNKLSANLRRHSVGTSAFGHRYKSQLQNRYGQSKRYKEEQLVWRHPGGVVSLLEILGGVLKSTEEQLVAIGNIASLTDFVQNVI